MGNRAVITTKENFENNGIGIYLHWNGGYDSVSAFLKYCEIKGYRTPDTDNYGWARLCQVIGNFFGGTTSIGIDTVDKLDCDNYDNGVYIIEGWEVVDRKYKRFAEQMNHSMEDMLEAIDNAMPRKERLGGYLKAKEIPTSELTVGDTVYIMNYDGEVLSYKVMGIGEDVFVNGTKVYGVPYVNKYVDVDGNYNHNINNYIHTETVRIVEDVVEDIEDDIEK